MSKVGLWDDMLRKPYEVEQLKSVFASSLYAVLTVGTMDRIPLLVVNNTNQTVTLRGRCPIARLNQVDSFNTTPPLETKRHHVKERELDQVNVPEEFRVLIYMLQKKNRNLFATNGKDLCGRDMVKMRINTDGQVAIKKKVHIARPSDKEN